MTRPTGPILVINPNASKVVTQAIANAIEPLKPACGLAFETVCVAHGPETISTQADATQAALDVAEVVQSRPDAVAFISACFSDPGVDLCRSLVPQPVLGIQEAGILTAMARADLFGIVALGPASVERHRLRIRQMGVESRLAGELPLPNISAEDAGQSEEVFRQTVQLGTDLKSKGARALVLGCAGFSPRTSQLEEALGIAVVDPVVAAAAMSIGMVN
ncbi:aspartate/glutamate racemase family protein [Roseobacter sinensis]|uniref:Aspartate/glutamate racemase family protein n=1 Tax=Roseobacter sinensis TaxID=2931391 RepID=A0ABT3BLD3_9RHOB|nr:aspartate/glutamate racemase family protein [Roseobacter sp. WL0113]MCV3274378.1 aspartate/glutamate racemase family protein [Roseobacter sp. WL0113]